MDAMVKVLNHENYYPHMDITLNAKIKMQINKQALSFVTRETRERKQERGA
jgi:hypothetical protein